MVGAASGVKRGTLLALAFAAAVGGWILLFERGEPESGDETERVFGVEADEIDEITLTRPGLPEVRLRRGAEGFLVASGDRDPVPADPAEADSLLQNVAALGFTRTLEAGSNADDFGLDPPALRLGVTAGDETWSAAFGDETLTGGSRYLRFQDAALLTPAHSFRNFDRSAWDLRDLRVFRGDPAVRGMRLRAGDREAALVREGGDWSIAVPFRIAADPFSASQLAGTLADLRMLALAEGETIETPRLVAEIDLDRGDGETGTRAVVFGADRPPGVLAQVVGDPLAFVVAAEPVEELEDALGSGLESIRSLRLFDLPVWQVDEMRFESDDAEIAFLRTEDEEATVWTLADGESPPDSGAVEDLLHRLSRTEAEAVGGAPADALVDPDWIVRLRREDASEPATVRFQVGPERVQALRDGDERVLLLPRGEWDGIRALLDAARPPNPP